MPRRRQLACGVADSRLFVIIALGALLVLFGGFGIWSFMSYLDQKSDVDAKIDTAVAKERKSVSLQKDQELEAYKGQLTNSFVGPADFGSVSFEYPRSWSAYVDIDDPGAQKTNFAAYFHPNFVPPLNSDRDLAFMVQVYGDSAEKSASVYDTLVAKGDVKSTPYSENGLVGTLFTGQLGKDYVGTELIVKLRDRTLSFSTDGEVFSEQFYEILKTVKFDK